ncbi:Ig-like domain repeat protein [Nocardioides sp. IC4_145]|uniref:Ig-like domain-containing protein n=1 Tax=Nocardioides sp. IC4_145 TaxID=2714037 RepID=UPI001409976A|nr:Ig-like domain-containing protein [Nocardioides sp. IC4_145]NHC23850.1 Ig-like domain repeat protein [Nocardioides sp. IC4_145]
MRIISAIAAAVLSASIASPAGATPPPRFDAYPLSDLDAGAPIEVRLRITGSMPEHVSTGPLRVVLRQDGAVVWSKTKPQNAHGAARFSTPGLAAGRYALVARYLPDADATLPPYKKRRVIVVE